jgi:hypothetical protein
MNKFLIWLYSINLALAFINMTLDAIKVQIMGILGWFIVIVFCLVMLILVTNDKKQKDK